MIIIPGMPRIAVCRQQMYTGIITYRDLRAQETRGIEITSYNPSEASMRKMAARLLREKYGLPKEAYRILTLRVEKTF